MKDLVIMQFSVSTAEDEVNYFTGTEQASRIAPIPQILPPGNYRIMDGKLYRVIPGISEGANASKPHDSKAR